MEGEAPVANKGGAPVGNRYAAKAKVWQMAIERALEKRGRAAQREALDDLAEVLLKKCDEGDIGALKELGDRLDGKSVQGIVAQGSITVSIAGSDAGL